jgi:hypothetical protein
MPGLYARGLAFDLAWVGAEVKRWIVEDPDGFPWLILEPPFTRLSCPELNSDDVPMSLANHN